MEHYLILDIVIVGTLLKSEKTNHNEWPPCKLFNHAGHLCLRLVKTCFTMIYTYIYIYIYIYIY